MNNYEFIAKSNYRIKILMALIIAITISIVGCKGNEPADNILTPEQSEKVTLTMIEWLECEECTEDQLSAVVKNAKVLRPMLISTLKKGAAPASRELLRIELEKRYDEITEYSKTHPGTELKSTKKEFVELYLGKFDAQYRTRAATALGAIGGKNAKEALQEALKKANRDDVKETILSSIKKMK